MATNPYAKLTKLSDILPTLSEIQNKIETCQSLVETADRSESIQSHFNAGLALSDLEITMSNFAVVLRERFRV